MFFSAQQMSTVRKHGLLAQDRTQELSYSSQPRNALRYRGALSKLLKREGRAGAEGAILPYVAHLQLILTLKIGADCCQVCQYKLTKPYLP